MGQQYGGKGGGAGAGPQLQQPSQSSTTQSQTPQRYQPTGPNIFGYNMNRLASRMDPSASLPGDNTQQQQPQYQEMPIPQSFQGSFGGKGGGRGAYEPDFFEPQYQPQYPQQYPQQYQQQPQQQQNPFAEKQSQYESQISSLQDRLDKLISQQQAGAKPAADSELSDTGEDIYAMDPGRTATGVGEESFVPEDATLSPEDVQEAQQTKADTAATEAAKIDPATGKPKYQFGTYVAPTTEQLSGLSTKSNITAYYKSQATKASQDLAQAKKDLANANKSGNIEARIAAQAAVNEATSRQRTIATDQKRTLSQVGKTGYQTTEQIQQAAAAKPAPAPKPTAAPKAAKAATPAPKASPMSIFTGASPAPAPKAAKPAAAPKAAKPAAAPKASAPAPAPKASAPAPAPKAAAPAPAPKPAKAPSPPPSVRAGIISGAKSSKKAKGGAIIVHKGMTPKLKKQLKNK
jgi:hypothetical protein